MQQKNDGTITLAMRAVAASAVVMVLAGCAAGALQGPPEQQVQARANARWAALVARDFKTAYEFTTPAYRAVTDFNKHMQGQGSAVGWKAAEAVSVRCPETTKCIATVRIDAAPFLGRKFGDTISAHTEETWLLDGGQWWLFQKL